MVERVDSTDVLFRDLNRLLAPDRPVGELRADVTAFIADAVQLGLPPETYNFILGNVVETIRGGTALSHLRSSSPQGRERFIHQTA